MIRACFLAFLTTCVAGMYPVYPIHRHVLFDPQTYDLLYNSSKGAVSETWYLTTAMTLTGFVLPSRVKECVSDEVYNEDVTVTVTQVVSSVNVPVAFGRHVGQQAYGREMFVSLYNETVGQFPKLARSVNYYVKISLKAGLYPWHLSRPLSNVAGFHSTCNAAGYIIGVEYSS